MWGGERWGLGMHLEIEKCKVGFWFIKWFSKKLLQIHWRAREARGRGLTKEKRRGEKITPTFRLEVCGSFRSTANVVLQKQMLFCIPTYCITDVVIRILRSKHSRKINVLMFLKCALLSSSHWQNCLMLEVQTRQIEYYKGYICVFCCSINIFFSNTIY